MSNKVLIVIDHPFEGCKKIIEEHDKKDADADLRRGIRKILTNGGHVVFMQDTTVYDKENSKISFEIAEAEREYRRNNWYYCGEVMQFLAMYYKDSEALNIKNHIHTAIGACELITALRKIKEDFPDEHLEAVLTGIIINCEVTACAITCQTVFGDDCATLDTGHCVYSDKSVFDRELRNLEYANVNII